MGDAADDLYNYMERKFLDDYTFMEMYKKGILEWKTRNEGEILVQDMTDRHIINTYKMLISSDKSKEWQEVFELEMDKRGIEFDSMI